MRMWMIDPRLMCMQHILGEHAEIHKHRHNFVKHHSIAGRIGQIEPSSMKERHDELVNFLKSHKSPYEQPDLSYYDIAKFKVNKQKSIEDLHSRCDKCRVKIEKHWSDTENLTGKIL